MCTLIPSYLGKAHNCRNDRACTAFVSNCDLDSIYIARIQSQDCVVFQCIAKRINVLAT